MPLGQFILGALLLVIFVFIGYAIGQTIDSAFDDYNDPDGFV